GVALRAGAREVGGVEAEAAARPWALVAPEPERLADGGPHPLVVGHRSGGVHHLLGHRHSSAWTRTRGCLDPGRRPRRSAGRAQGRTAPSAGDGAPVRRPATPARPWRRAPRAWR